MGHSFNLTLKSEDGATARIVGEFDDPSLALIDQYISQCVQLEDCRPVREGFARGFKLVMGESSAEDVTPLPDRETISSLLHELRPFVLENEPASYAATSGLVARRVAAPEVRAFLKQNRRLYDGRASQTLYTIALNDTVVNSEAVLQKWLNGLEYHRDPVKAAEVEAIFATLGEGPAVGIFLSLLNDKVAAIANLRGLVALLAGKTKSVSFRLER